MGEKKPQPSLAEGRAELGSGTIFTGDMGAVFMKINYPINIYCGQKNWVEVGQCQNKLSQIYSGCTAYAVGCAAYGVGWAAYAVGCASYVHHSENKANSVQLS